jgi:hypothetical protein
MAKASLATITALALLVRPSFSDYTLKTDLSHSKFFENFELYSDEDPTKGFVQYQNLSSAISNEHIGYLDNNSIFLGTDYTTKNPNGRASVRAESKINFNHGLLVADIIHMPVNECGVWPAFWTLGEKKWPEGGEIDILEGVNDETRNAITLHTSAGCVVNNATMGGNAGDEPQEFTGWMKTDDCNVKAQGQENNEGCKIKAPVDDKAPSYGTPFNDIGGGVYAVEWTDSFIQAWFFPRDSPDFPSLPSVPLDETSSPPTLDTSKWPKPVARFSGSGCDFTSRFKDQRIIFNTAFCGDWAGEKSVWAQSCQKKTGVEKCEDYVRDNPEAFKEAFWEISGLWWFEEKKTEEKRGLGQIVHSRGRDYKW